MIFKSEEERDLALESISSDPADAPVGMTIDDFLEANERKIDEILNAEISEMTEEIPELVQSTQSEESELDKLRRRSEELENEQARMREEHANELEELRAKKQAEPARPPEPNIADTEIESLEKRISELESSLGEEIDVLDEDQAKKSRELSRLMVKLNLLSGKRNRAIIEDQRKEIETLKTVEVQKSQKKSEEASRKKSNEAIEDFRQTVPELKGKSYETLDTEYVDFAKKLASIYYDVAIADVTAGQAEVAVDKYMKKVPSIIDKAVAKGVKKPDGLEQYIVLSDVNNLRKGYIVDTTTGKWKKLKDNEGNPVTFPDFESAYNYYKKINKLPAKLNLDSDNRSTKSLMNALNQRSNVVELDESHKPGEIIEMSKSEAQNVMMKYSEDFIAIKARRNFNDPAVQEYNKALGILGEAMLTREDFE